MLFSIMFIYVIQRYGMQNVYVSLCIQIYTVYVYVYLYEHTYIIICIYICIYMYIYIYNYMIQARLSNYIVMYFAKYMIHSQIPLEHGHTQPFACSAAVTGWNRKLTPEMVYDHIVPCSEGCIPHISRMFQALVCLDVLPTQRGMAVYLIPTKVKRWRR